MLGRKDFVKTGAVGVNVSSGRRPGRIVGSTFERALAFRVRRTSAWRTDDGRRGDCCPAVAGLPGGCPGAAGAVLMSAALAAGLQIFVVVAALALVHVPLGDYMARVFTPAKHNRVERSLYRTLRI